MTESQWSSYAATLQAALTSHERWRQVAKWFSGTIELRRADEVLSVVSSDCAAPIVTAEPLPRGNDVVIAGSAEGWDRVLNGELNLLSANGAGALQLGGNAVLAMQQLRVVALTVDVLVQTVGRAPTVTPSPSPASSPADITGRYVDVSGRRIYVEEAGSGTPIVCFHAAGQDTMMYRHVIDALASHYRVIAVDAPGHGKSSPLSDAPWRSITQHAEHNERLLDALGLERPILLGCSMAGNMVLEMAARRPDDYRAVVSAEGAAFTPSLDEFTLDMLITCGPVVVEPFAQSLTGRRTPADRAAEVVWQIMRTTPEVIHGDLSGYAAFDIRERLDRVAAPVLLIRGGDDWLVDHDKVNDTLRCLPTASMITLDGTGHYPMIENPVEFAEHVAAFLNELR